MKSAAVFAISVFMGIMIVQSVFAYFGVLSPGSMYAQKMLFGQTSRDTRVAAADTRFQPSFKNLSLPIRDSLQRNFGTVPKDPTMAYKPQSRQQASAVATTMLDGTNTEFSQVTKHDVQLDAQPFDYGSYARPSRITIDAIGVDALINIPESTGFNEMDRLLRQGVVYYPGSARFGEYGNTFLFGHSSWLPIVHNKNYTIFNKLNSLKQGDLIIIHASERNFVYKVRGKRIASKHEGWVDLGNKKEKILTLSTCDSFGARDDRIVIEALLVEA